MDILNSSWLIQMLTKAGKTPQARLLSLFDILDDWSSAPGMSEQFQSTGHDDANALKNYLSLEAAKAGAALPEMLATQLHMMAASAIQEKLIGQNPAALTHARNTASALITAQTKKEFHIPKSTVYAMAASFIGALVVGSGLLFYNNTPTTSHIAQVAKPTPAHMPNKAVNTTASPQSTFALMKQIEQMRSGNCQLLEAIQLPDEHKSVYFKNIVLGQISTDPMEQKLVKILLGKIRCNYSPMLMKKST